MTLDFVPYVSGQPLSVAVFVNSFAFPWCTGPLPSGLSVLRPLPTSPDDLPCS